MAKHYSLLLIAFFMIWVAMATATDFNAEMGQTWGGERVQILENGNLLQLQLDQESSSGYQFKNQYLFGRFAIQIKLVPGNSAGTVTDFFLQSPRPNNNEIDFEFLGNVSESEPYVLHTNLWVRGQGDREQQFYLWFDPRQDFHTYSVLWNPQQIVWYVDETPIRVYRNVEGVPYPNEQPLDVFLNIWNGEGWATRIGQVGIDWSAAPFRAWYRNFNADACVWSSGSSLCPESSSNWMDRTLDASETEKIQWARQNYMIRDYCQDPGHFPQGMPPECSLSKPCASVGILETKQMKLLNKNGNLHVSLLSQVECE